MMCQTRKMTKTVKNTRQRAHQSCTLWSQVLSLRVIKTSHLLLPKWPIRNQCPRCRSCLQPTTSISTSTSPASEPPLCSRPFLAHHTGPGPHHPPKPAQVVRHLLPSSIL